MKLIEFLRRFVRRNADPIACACAVFTKQIAALDAHIETQNRAVEKDAIAIAKANERIDAALNAQHRAAQIKRNIEAIVGGAA